MKWYEELSIELKSLLEGTHQDAAHKQSIQNLIDDLDSGLCEPDAVVNRLHGLELSWFAARLENEEYQRKEAYDQDSV